MDEQLSYDTGPQVEDEQAEPSAPDEGDGRSIDAPWKVGLGAGVGTFVVVYAIMYQLASAMTAAGTLGPPRPSHRVLAGLMMLGSHGATIEPEEGLSELTFGVFGLVTNLASFAVMAALVAAGYLLVRYAATDDVETTARTAARAGGGFAAGYLVLSVLLAAFATWTPREEESDGPAGGVTGTEGIETISVPLDVSLLTAVGGTVAAFLALGGALALLATFGYPFGDVRSGGTPADGRETGAGDGSPTDERDGGRSDRRDGSDRQHGDRRSADPDRGDAAGERRYDGPDGRDDRGYGDTGYDDQYDGYESRYGDSNGRDDGSDREDEGRDRRTDGPRGERDEAQDDGRR